MKLTVEQTYLLHILGCALQEQPLKVLPDSENFSWSALLQEATAQTVFTIFFDVHKSYTFWSMEFMTTYSHKINIISARSKFNFCI